MRFNIRFTFNRFPIRNMHRAAEFISREAEMKSFVFPACSDYQLQGTYTVWKNEKFTLIWKIIRENSHSVDFVPSQLISRNFAKK